MIVIEATAVIDPFGTTKTFYLSTDQFTTGATDSPPHVSFLPRLTDPGSLGVHAYGDSSTTSGSTELESGTVTLANTDGELDVWLDYGFDGQRIVIRSGEADAPYPYGFVTLFQGTAEGVDASWTEITLKIRDKQYLLDVPALTTKYLGNNALPLGIEGTAADLKDQLKPLLLGVCFQVPAKLVNTSKLTYQLSYGALASIQAVYDRGVVLTPGTNFATSALLLASSPASGGYNTCLAEGLFQLGASPAGTVTADATEGAAAADRTVAQILNRLAVIAGLSSSVSILDIAALDALNSSVVGIWVDGTTSFLSAMDELVASIGAWYGFDSAGLFRMGVLTVPGGTPRLSLSEYDFKQDIERRSARDNNIPVWKLSMNHTKLWTTQTDLAGSVTAANKAYMAQTYRTAVEEDAQVKTQFNLATTLEISGLLTDPAAAAAEAVRQLSLLKSRRDIFEVTLSVARLPVTSLMFMDVIELTSSRFGLASGKMFRLLGITYKLATNEVTLTVWG